MPNYFSPTVIGSYHDIAETMALNNSFSPTVIGSYHDIAETMALNNYFSPTAIVSAISWYEQITVSEK
jgi:3-dehydroquinate dehydratase